MQTNKKGNSFGIVGYEQGFQSLHFGFYGVKMVSSCKRLLLGVNYKIVNDVSFEP